jgi:hypothetical protein
LPGTAEPGWTTAAEAWRDVYEALSADARQKMSSVYPVADAMALAKFAAVPISGTRHGRDTRRNALADQELTASHLLRNLFASITPRIAPDRAKPSKSLAKPLPRQKISNGTPDFSFVAPNCAPRSGRGKFTSDFGAKGAAPAAASSDA